MDGVEVFIALEGLVDVEAERPRIAKVIADLEAGTYRDLVEAAESCQVCIVHPGVPGNPQEPGLPELIERAEPFS